MDKGLLLQAHGLLSLCTCSKQAYHRNGKLGSAVAWKIRLKSSLNCCMAIFKILTMGSARGTTNQNRLRLNNQYGHSNTNQLEIISNDYSLINKPKGLPRLLKLTWDLNVKSSVLNRKKKCPSETSAR